MTINTHRGLFRYHRLPFGVHSAPGIFQLMEELLQGLEGVVVYLDDTLITGGSRKEHLQHLEEVLKRFQDAGLRVKRDKCRFMEEEVTYLGHRISGQGLHPTEDKVKAVQEAPTPTGASELRAYLVMLTYYDKFLPHRASVLAPLYSLLKKGIPWIWTKAQEDAFQASKALRTSSRVLTHFTPTLPVILACDASPRGIGAVLSHRLANGDEHPITYASRFCRRRIRIIRNSTRKR